jgi:transcriptional regulator with XRE-family HTH domain
MVVCMSTNTDTKQRSGYKSDKYSLQFAERLRDARGEMPQTELLSLLKEQGLELTQARLSHYENGRNYPDPPILAALATALGVSADWLLGLTTEELPVADLQEKLAAATGEHRINKIMRKLPKDKQEQVMTFAEYLLSVEQKAAPPDNLAAWRAAMAVLEARMGEEGIAAYLSFLEVEHPDIAVALRTDIPKKKYMQSR